MKLDVGDLRLFGVDLSQLYRWWRRGLTSGKARHLLAHFIKPSPRLWVIVDGQTLSFRQTDAQDVQREQARVTLEPNGVQEFDRDLRAALLAGIREDLLQVGVLWPADQVLSKRLLLPVAATDNLREVLSYQVGRLTPFSPEKLYYDAKVLQIPDTQTLDPQTEVEMFAVAREQVDPLITRVESLSGLTVSRLAVEGHEDVNLFGDDRVSNRWWLRLNRNSFLLIGVILASALAVIAPVLKERSLVLERKQMIAQLQPQVQELISLKDTLDHSLDGLGHIEQRRAAAPSVIQMLAEMTRLLPDEFHIRALELQNNVVTITGEGPRAVDLIQAINSSPMFEDARFSSAVSRNAQMGLDQFSITMTLVAPTASEDQP